VTGVPRLTLWPLGALLLGGGFAAGYFVGAGGQGEAIETMPAVDRDGAPAEAPGALPLRTESAPEPRLEGPNAAELEPLRRAIEALPPPEVPTGDGVIAGRVLTDDGAPLAGVRVAATPAMPEEMQAAARRDRRESPDLPTSVRDFVRRMRWSGLARREAVTDAEGTYRIEGLVQIGHSVQAGLEGWKIRPTGRDPWAVQPGAEVDFQATRRCAVRIQVYLPNGTQPEQAMLSFQAGSSGTNREWRRAEPDVEVDPGSWSVSALIGDALRSPSVEVTVEAGGTPPEVRLDLAARLGVKGRVTFEDDQRTSGARVRLARIPQGRDADPALLTTGARDESLHSFEDGPLSFSFLDLAPGRYLVGVSRAWQGLVVAWKEVEVSDSVVEVELEIPALEREEYVILRVLGPDGESLPKVDVKTGFRSKNSSSSGGSVVLDRPDGVRWVLHHQANVDAGAEDARLWIGVSARGYGYREVEYEPGTAPSLEVRFAAPAMLEVTITGLAGNRYEGRVTAGLHGSPRTDGWGGSHGASEPDAQGRVTFGAVQPGPHVLVLSIRGDPFGGSVIAEKEIELSSGANSVRIAMPELYEVVLEGLTGTGWLSRRGNDGFHRTVASTQDGRAVVDALPAGTYTARAGQKQATFTVPGATTVRLE